MNDDNWLSPLEKGLGILDGPIALSEVRAKRWNLLQEDLSLPVAVLYQDRIEHNLDWMRRFVEAYGAKLCPHGKTTMAPALFRRQIEAGAWGITLANAVQARIAYEHGVRRVLMANQLVGRQNLQVVSDLLKDPSFDFYCLIDSPEHVRHLGTFFSSRGQKVKTLIEVGTEGARAGIREMSQLGPIVEECKRFRKRGKGTVEIVGVELFEGIFKEEPPVRPFIQQAIDAARGLVALGGVQGSHVMISGAGSTWFDIVAEMCSSADVGLPIDLVLRPGCYITHDCGSFVEPQRRMTSSNAVVQSLGQGLLPSLQVWAYVQSLPAPGLAIVGMGKRDASFDSGLPVPSLRFRPGEERPEATPAGWEVTKIMDQHAFLSISSEDDVRIGDMVGFDISHPCTTFDKWKYLAVIDPDYTVVDMVKTFF